MKALLHFFGYNLIHSNDLNALYGSLQASRHRLINIDVSNKHLSNAVEKDQILNLLTEASQIIKKIIR